MSRYEYKRQSDMVLYQIRLDKAKDLFFELHGRGLDTEGAMDKTLTAYPDVRRKDLERSLTQHFDGIALPLLAKITGVLLAVYIYNYIF